MGIVGRWRFPLKMAFSLWNFSRPDKIDCTELLFSYKESFSELRNKNLPEKDSDCSQNLDKEDLIKNVRWKIYASNHFHQRENVLTRIRKASGNNTSWSSSKGFNDDIKLKSFLFCSRYRKSKRIYILQIWGCSFSGPNEKSLKINNLECILEAYKASNA